MKECKRSPFREEFSGMGEGKKTRVKMSSSNIHNATRPTIVEPTKAETLEGTWVPARA
jgi:hypothetical protein